MWRPSRSTAICSAILAALTSIGAAQSARGEASTNRIAFADERGENPGAIEVSRVVVSSTTDGEIVFRIGLPTKPAFTDDMRIEIWIDADLLRDTGMKNDQLHVGGDYLVVVSHEVTTLYGCENPPACDVFAPVPLAEVQLAYREGATITLAARHLKHSKRFRFSVLAADGIGGSPNDLDSIPAHVDFAPREGAWWTFDTRALVVTSFSATPRTPVPGRPFALRLTTIRTGSGAALAAGTISCSLRIGGHAISPHSSEFVRRRAVCAFDVPSGTRGLRYRAAITVRARANAVSRSLSGRVG